MDLCDHVDVTTPSGHIVGLHLTGWAYPTNGFQRYYLITLHYLCPQSGTTLLIRAAKTSENTNE